MKKVGILTFPNSISFGATLQMYALCTAVSRMGYDAEFINYHNRYMKQEKHLEKQLKGSRWKHKLRTAVKNMLHGRQYHEFKKFEQSIPHYPKKATDDLRDLKLLSQRYNAVICGSDQVWSPDITNNDLSYFLDFCDDTTRRIAYAPSFGVEHLEADYKKEVANELKQFTALCVREAKGQQLVREMIGETIPLVMDPTFLLTANDWMKEEAQHPLANGKYILYYTVRSSAALMNFTRKLAEQHDMKIIVVGGNMVKKLNNKEKRIEYACDLNPREWLYLLHHASCVVTNSFHGAAFSINYRKNFYVEFSSLTNSRLEQLLQTAGLEGRKLGERTGTNAIEIDYGAVSDQIERAIEFSHNYLRTALNNE